MKKISAVAEAKLGFIASMVVFGTIGIFVKYIPLPSGIIAFVRGIVGAIFMFSVSVIIKKRPSFSEIKKKLIILIISGMAIGFNWIFLFESYKYTTVGTATLCYYMAPVFVMIASPFVLGERLSLKKIICVVSALVGMVFVSGIFNGGISGIGEVKGILFGLAAAMLYASVIILNQRLKDISAYDKTIVQLASAAFVILPYSLIRGEFSMALLEPRTLVLLLVVGVIHTGVAYTLYFASMKELSAQNVAIYSYIDPIIAIILSALLLHERLDIFGIIGAVLVLGSTLVCELPSPKCGKRR